MQARYSLNQFLTASYNAGDKDISNVYIPNNTIGPAGSSYSDRALRRFDQAQALMCGSGAYTCR